MGTGAPPNRRPVPDRVSLPSPELRWIRENVVSGWVRSTVAIELHEISPMITADNSTHHDFSS